MKKCDKIFFIICMAILLFFFCSITMRFFTREILIKRLNIKNSFTNLVMFDAPALSEDNTKKINIDWSELYPFSDDILDGKNKEKSSTEIYLDRVEKNIQKLEGTAENYTSDYLIGYQKITEWSKRYEDVLRWNYVSYVEYNGIVETEDHYFTTVTAKKDIQVSVDSTKSLSDYCKSRDIGFMYVNAPVKICEYTDANLSGVIDYSNQNADEYLLKLKNEGINYCDLRALLHTEDLDHHSLFYITDHHWRPETGLWATEEIAKKLNEDFGIDFDLSYVNSEHYTKKIYPKWFLGSQGKKVTLSKAEPEDFVLLYPQFDSSFHFEVPNKAIDNEGDFSITYDMSNIEVKDYYRGNPYATYYYADQPLKRIENNLIDNGVHILVVHNSFGNCVVPFLALGIQYTDSIDLRSFNGSLQNYIETEQPDIVIVMYPASTIDGPELKIGGEFDFR